MTALQELELWVTQECFNIEGQDGVMYLAVDVDDLIPKLKQLLELERQQIVDAWNNGEFRQGNNKHINNAYAYYDTLVKKK